MLQRLVVTKAKTIKPLMIKNMILNTKSFFRPHYESFYGILDLFIDKYFISFLDDR